MERTTKKIIQVLTYIAYLQPNHRINSMKAYKLIWLADRYHLRQYGRTITGDAFFAMPHGVVPSDAKNVVEHQSTHIPNDEKYRDKYIQRVNKYTYQAITSPDTNVFSDSDQEVLDIILGTYGHLNQYDLEKLSHTFPEWIPYKEKLKDPKAPSSYKIDAIAFFDNPENDSMGLFSDDFEKLTVVKEYYREFNPR